MTAKSITETPRRVNERGIAKPVNTVIIGSHDREVPL